MIEAWVTDDDLTVATDRFASTIPGYALPVAQGVARLDQGALTFGHVNKIGAIRALPAAILAGVCGYANKTGTFRMSYADFAEAVRRLAPAEAATHMPHPNLWSWRELLAAGTSDSEFLAFFVASADDAPVDEYDVQFRELITSR